MGEQVVTTIVALAIFGAALLALAALSSMLLRWPLLGLYLIGAFAIIAWEIPDTPPVVSIAGIQVKIEDVVCVSLLLATVTRGRNLKSVLNGRWLVFAVFVLCVGISLLLGVVANGPQAFNEARSTVWFVLAATWLITQNWESLGGHIRGFVVFVGLALCLVMVTHILQYGWGSADSFVESATGVLQTGRPLVSGQALVLLCCGLMLVLSKRSVRLSEIVSGYVFIAAAILCMHRSVWVAAALSLLVLAIALRGRTLALSLILAFYTAVVVACFAAVGSMADLASTVSHAVSSDGTLNAREGSWSELVAQSVEQGPWTVIFGTAFGAGFGRVVNGLYIDFNPHNWYVVIYLRLGLFGLTLLTSTLVFVLVKLSRRSAALLAVAIAITAYAWFYHLPWYVTPWFGLTLWASLKYRFDTHSPALAADRGGKFEQKRPIASLGRADGPLSSHRGRPRSVQRYL